MGEHAFRLVGDLEVRCPATIAESSVKWRGTSFVGRRISRPLALGLEKNHKYILLADN